MKIASVDQMRRCDAYTIEHHVPSMELICRAAYSVFCAVEWHGRIAIAVGSGNNGADGFALACILKEHHYDCTVFVVSSRLHAECAAWSERAEAEGVTVMQYDRGCFDGFDILVDCMLGTGFNGCVKERYRNAIYEMNASEAYVVSVDINSGMDGDNGAGEVIVQSDLTVTIEFVKCGQLLPNAGKYMKRLVCVQIGIVDSEGLRELSKEKAVPWLDMESKNYALETLS